MNRQNDPRDGGNSGASGELSRRQFVVASAGAAVGAAVAAATPAFADQASRAKAEGALYTESTGYGDRDIRGWRGRTVFGATIGIIQLEVQIPMPPGDMGNATTFDFPVLYEGLGEIDPNWVVSSEPHPEVLRRSIEAGKRLEMQGVRAIVGNCGFFANYQTELAKALSVPFFNGSLMQVPMVLLSIRPDQKVGILTANGAALKEAPALAQCGVSDMSRIVIYGAEHGENMKKILSDSDNYNMKGLERELVALAKQMVEEHPEVGAVVLECSEFPPHAFAIQDAIRRDCWGFTTLVNWMHAGALRKPFTGLM